MKQIFQRARNVLLNDAAVVAIAGQRFYALRAPQNVLVPYGLLSATGTARQQHLRGVAALENMRLRLDLFGDSFNTLLDLDDVVRAALHATNVFSAQYVFGFTLYEDDTRLFHVVADYSVWNDNL